MNNFLFFLQGISKMFFLSRYQLLSVILIIYNIIYHLKRHFVSRGNKGEFKYTI